MCVSQLLRSRVVSVIMPINCQECRKKFSDRDRCYPHRIVFYSFIDIPVVIPCFLNLVDFGASGVFLFLVSRWTYSEVFLDAGSSVLTSNCITCSDMLFVVFFELYIPRGCFDVYL